MTNTFEQHPDGGWVERGAVFPLGSTARIFGGYVFSQAAAKMYGGEFYGGVFRCGAFWGGEFHKSPSMAQRSDGYCFVAKYVNDDLRIWAGCRNFSWDEAIQHWDDSHKHGAETQRILHFLKAQEDAARAEEEKT